jgi:DegV family protein with EDD domain
MIEINEIVADAFFLCCSAIMTSMGQNRIAILTDSTCDIPPHLIEEFSIQVQPHVLIWNGQQLRDRVDIRPEEFYRRLGEEKSLPTTSQASVQDFADAFQCAYENGASSIVAVLVNSGFSGAIRSAQLAVENAPIPVYIHDSRGATMGLGWQVLAAARKRACGGDVAEVLDAAEQVRRRMQLYICLDTLEYVYRGGRIGNARRMVGTVLNIKPLILVDHEKGIVEPAGMALTRRKAIDLLYKSFFSSVGSQKNLRVAVMHGNAAEEASALFERVRTEFSPTELLTNITCPTLGINTGPRALALCGYAED